MAIRRSHRSSGIEPSVGSRDDRGEFGRIAVGMMVIDGIPGTPEQVPAVDKRNGAFAFWPFRHDWHINNPAGAFRRVRRGAIADWL